MQHASAKVTRRTVIEGGSLFLLGAGTVFTTGRDLCASGDEDDPKLRIGLVTDLHYADKSPAGSRHYRESLSKLAEAGEAFSTVQPDIVVELGDFIDAARFSCDGAELPRTDSESLRRTAWTEALRARQSLCLHTDQG